MKEMVNFLLWLVLAFAVVEAQYLKHRTHRFYNGRSIKLAPKEAIWRQMHSSPTEEKAHLAIEADQFPAASDHESSHHHGRVQMKVYRGPDDHHHDFAPYGFWIKQPADDGY